MGLATFIRGKWSWAKRKPLFWANLLLVGITSLVVFVYPGPMTDTGPSDTRIRLWAMFLQLLGAWTVWHDLTSSARAFGEDTILKDTWSWFRSLAGRQHITAGSLHACGASLSAYVRGGQRRTAPDGATTETRMSVLEFNLDQIDQDLSTALNEIDKVDQKHLKKHTEERSAREAAIKAVDERLRGSIVGNYTNLAFGALWVVIGVVLSALAPEIAKAVAGQWPQVWSVL